MVGININFDQVDSLVHAFDSFSTTGVIDLQGPHHGTLKTAMNTHVLIIATQDHR